MLSSIKDEHWNTLAVIHSHPDESPLLLAHEPHAVSDKISGLSFARPKQNTDFICSLHIEILVRPLHYEGGLENQIDTPSDSILEKLSYNGSYDVTKKWFEDILDPVMDTNFTQEHSWAQAIHS